MNSRVSWNFLYDSKGDQGRRKSAAGVLPGSNQREGAIACDQWLGPQQWGWIGSDQDRG